MRNLMFTGKTKLKLWISICWYNINFTVFKIFNMEFLFFRWHRGVYLSNTTNPKLNLVLYLNNINEVCSPDDGIHGPHRVSHDPLGLEASISLKIYDKEKALSFDVMVNFFLKKKKGKRRSIA